MVSLDTLIELGFEPTPGERESSNGRWPYTNKFIISDIKLTDNKYLK